MPHPTPLDERLAYIAEKEAWLKTLQPSPVPDFLTGNVIRPPDPRDDHLIFDPKVAASLETGAAEAGDLLQWVKGPPLNQGAVGSCTSHTGAGGQAIFQQQEEGIWRVFDAPRVHLETGPIGTGRYPEEILKYGRDIGFPIVGGDQRWRINAWAYVTADDLWDQTIVAALSAGKPVWISTLIPAEPDWETARTLTQGYHEILGLGWRPGYTLIRNSWGAWGRNRDGFSWVPNSYFKQTNFQNGLCRVFSVVDERAQPPIPTPIPPIPTPIPPIPTPGKIVVTGNASGSGANRIELGQTLLFSGNGFGGALQVTDVRKDTAPLPPIPPIPPNPGGLAVDLKIYRAGRYVYTDVKATGPESGLASLKWSGGAGTLPNWVNVNGGLVRGILFNTVPGQMIWVEATLGMRTGWAEKAVPA